MINKKLLPLMGISALLLIVNLPQADADLCGDTINLDVVLGSQPGGTSIFSGSDVVEWSDSFALTPEVDVGFTVFCDGGAFDPPGDGTSFIFFDYFCNATATTCPIPEHSFWFTDLEWVDAVTGEVTDFTVSFSETNTQVLAPGWTQNTVHAITPAQDLIAGSSINDLQITAMHPVGGEFSPISTSALLLAGGQNMIAWMIPLVVAAAGFGLVIARKL
jgi:hypothetical protein